MEWTTELKTRNFVDRSLLGFKSNIVMKIMIVSIMQRLNVRKAGTFLQGAAAEYNEPRCM